MSFDIITKWSNRGPDMTRTCRSSIGVHSSRVSSRFHEFLCHHLSRQCLTLTITRLVYHLVYHWGKNSRDLNSDDFFNWISDSVPKLHVWWGKTTSRSVGDTLVHVWVTGGDCRRHLKYRQKSWVFWGNSKSTSGHISVNTGRSEPNEGSIWTSDTFRAQRAHF